MKNVFMVLFLCLLLSTCRADVVFKGSPLQSKAWSSTYSRISSVWRVKDRVTMTMMTDRAMNNFILSEMGPVPFYRDVDGLYMQRRGEDATIHIRQTTPDLLEDMVHEYGHHVWFNLLSKMEREEYKELWVLEPRRVTSYADTSPEEGFAEDFAYYILYPKALDHISPASALYLSRKQFLLSLFRTNWCSL